MVLVDDPREKLREVLIVLPARTSSVVVLIVAAPAWSPRLAEELICTVPAVRVVPPVYPFVPLRTTVPAELTFKAPPPLMTPAKLPPPSMRVLDPAIATAPSPPFSDAIV